jgi:hypothetical protein
MYFRTGSEHVSWDCWKETDKVAVGLSVRLAGATRLCCAPGGALPGLPDAAGGGGGYATPCPVMAGTMLEAEVHPGTLMGCPSVMT